MSRHVPHCPPHAAPLVAGTRWRRRTRGPRRGRVAAAARLAPSGQAAPLRSADGHGAFVPRHDGLRRSGVHQELQPVHRHRPPERPVRQGRGLRGPHDLARGRQADAAVARAHLEVVERQQDADAQPREGRQVVRRQAADVGRRRLQPHAGKQNKVMDIIGFTRPDTNIASVKAKGTYAVVINLKTRRLAVHRRDAERRST